MTPKSLCAIYSATTKTHKQNSQNTVFDLILVENVKEKTMLFSNEYVCREWCISHILINLNEKCTINSGISIVMHNIDVWQNKQTNCNESIWMALIIIRRFLWISKMSDEFYLRVTHECCAFLIQLCIHCRVSVQFFFE